MSTLAEMKQHPYWKVIVPFWEVHGVTDDDLPDEVPEPPNLMRDPNSPELITDSGYNPDTWLAEKFPKVFAKLDAAVTAAIDATGEPNA